MKYTIKSLIKAWEKVPKSGDKQADFMAITDPHILAGAVLAAYPDDRVHALVQLRYVVHTAKVNRKNAHYKLCKDALAILEPLFITPVN